MKLAELTWQDVAELSRDIVVLIPTGAVEQHGPHLPLATDTLLATAAAEDIEAQLPDLTLLTPTLWLGASLHHMPFSGTLSHSFTGYDEALKRVILSLAEHRFIKFMTINGHGGNCDLNRVAMRDLKSQNPNLQLAAANYFDFPEASTWKDTLKGPTKNIRHACEAEASLMLHKFPHLVRKDRIRDDGLEPTPAIPGLITQFDEITEQGSLGHATYASAETGAALWQAIVAGGVQAVQGFADGYHFLGAQQ
ncbi:MAG: creatininase family protein [Fimbriimonadaceae bacterium]|nr:MAG: creatininase family protein [Fimbriimonadaceae bacterium]